MSARRLETFSIYPNPPAGAMMAVLRAYLDESGKDSDPGTPVVAVGGLVGSVEAWGAFERLWEVCLTKWQIPYLHMQELRNSGDGPFARFRDDSSLMWEMLSDFIDVISESELFSVSHIAIKQHVTAFNVEYRTSLNCYSLALYGCILEFSLKHQGQDIEVIIDKFDKSTQYTQQARGYCLSDNYYAEQLKWMKEATITAIGKNDSYKTVLPIQAADFVVWELRRAVNDILDFILNHKSGGDAALWHKQELQWSLNKFGKWPRNRPTIFRFGSRAPVESVIWDYWALCETHIARGGLW